MLCMNLCFDCSVLILLFGVKVIAGFPRSKTITFVRSVGAGQCSGGAMVQLCGGVQQAKIAGVILAPKMLQRC